MAVESAADRSAFLADFGSTVTWSGGSATAIYDQAYEEAEFPGAVSIGSRRPMLRAREADFAAVAVGTSVTVDGDTWRVAEKHPDGTGMTMILLEAA